MIKNRKKILDRRYITEQMMLLLMRLSALSILAILLFILYTIASKGLKSLSWEMIFSLPEGGYYLGGSGGIANAIAGSLIMIAGSASIAILLSLPIAFCINFILKKEGWFSGLARFSMDILFGIPSIVYGAFGFLIMIWLGLQASLLGGIIAVAFLILPIMVRAIDEVVMVVPHDLKESLQSLGATRYEMMKVILRSILPGVGSAIMLAIGRGIGDAATVLFTAGYTDSIPSNLTDPAATLPLAIFFQLSSPMEEVQDRAYAAALILTIIVLIISLLTRQLTRRIK